jgi:hypothetical protein
MCFRVIYFACFYDFFYWILEMFRPRDILELFRPRDILELFRPRDILELFRPRDIFILHCIPYCLR